MRGGTWWSPTSGSDTATFRPTSARRSGGRRSSAITPGKPGRRLKARRASSYDRPMAVTDDRPVADQLSELGAQLAWVRDYLSPPWAEGPTPGACVHDRPVT